MIIKSPCILDVSHWNRPDWPSLDGRVRGVIMKAAQGRYYVDPTFGSSWIGARSRPRSAYHFFEANDVPAQVANFLSACEDVGAIVGGKWKGEIEPVLDAEYQPSTSLSLLGKALGIKSRPKVRKAAALDLEVPEKYLIVNPRMRLAHAESIPANRSVTGAQLAAQYKQWLDLVEAELGVKPIVYTSKWMWNYTGNPAWSKEYKLWVAQYPFNPDGQDAPAYLPSAWDYWWLWQYTSEGALQGVAGEVDLNVFNGSEQEWDYFYGGGYGQPPAPPTGETMEVTPKESNGCKVRSAPVVDGTNVNQVGTLAYANKLVVSALSGTAGSEQWAQVTWNGAPGYVAVWYRGSQYAVLSGTLPPSTDPTRTHVVEVFSDGKISVDGGPHQ